MFTISDDFSNLKEIEEMNEYELTNDQPHTGYVTYNAKNKRSGLTYQVVSLPKFTLTQTTFTKQFRNIYEILGSIDNPHIQKFHEIIIHDRIYYMFLDNPGNSVFDTIEDGSQIEDTLASEIFLCLVDAVYELHSQNIIHGDISLENMAIINGDFKLSNFFYARAVDPNIKTYQYGTINYQAPEISLGSTDIMKADIWAMGIFLLTLLTGKLPYVPRNPEDSEEEKSKDILRQIKLAAPSIPSFLSADARSLLAGLLETSPARRLTIEAIRGHPFCVEARRRMAADDSSEILMKCSTKKPISIARKVISDLFLSKLFQHEDPGIGDANNQLFVSQEKLVKFLFSYRALGPTFCIVTMRLASVIDGSKTTKDIIQYSIAEAVTYLL